MDLWDHNKRQYCRTHSHTHTATFYSYYYKLGAREVQGSLQIQQLPAAAAAATITICPFVVDNQWAVALAEQEDEREGSVPVACQSLIWSLHNGAKGMPRIHSEHSEPDKDYARKF